MSISLSGSLVITGSIVASGGITGSFSGSATTSSYALTASSVNPLTQSLSVSGSITATGILTAQTLVVQTITSSIVYSSGSNIFGNQLTDVQQMTGSLRVTGSGNHYIQGGNVGIGTRSPSSFSGYTVASISGTSGGILDLMYNGTSQLRISAESGSNYISGVTNAPLYFYTNSALSLTLASTGAATFGSSVSTGGALNITVPYSAEPF